MAIEIPPTIDPAPLPAPQRGDRTTFSDRVDAFVTWLTAAVAQFGAVATNVYANATEALGYSVTAQNSAATAVAAANTATVAGGAAAWVSGQTYAQYANAISPIDFQTYRKITTATGGVVDPSLNATDWTRLTAVSIGAGGDGTITGSITLLSSSPGAMVVTPTAPGLYATLPDATLCVKGTAPFSIYNAGDYDYGVKNSAGTQIGWVRPRTGAVIGLAANATAAGVWPTKGLEKVGITANYVNLAITGMGQHIRRITVDANRTTFLFGGTDCYAITYDASTQSWGSATLVRASIGAGRFWGVLSAADQVLVVSAATTSLEAVTLTLSGTGITVNSGTKATASTGGTGINTNTAYLPQLIPVSTSWVFSYGVDTSSSVIRALTVSGTTPVIGASSTLNATAGGGGDAAQLYASGSVVRTLVGQNTSVLACKPFTVSGSTLAAGTEATAAMSPSSYRAFVNGNGNIVAHYLNTAHTAAIFKLTGTVEAVSTVSLGGTAPSGILSSKTDCAAVAAGKTLFIWEASPGVNFNILTDTAGTASAGTAVSFTSSASVAAVQALAVSGNTVRVGAGGAGRLTQVSVDCSGTSAVVGSSGSVLGISLTDTPVPLFAASDVFKARDVTALSAGGSLRLIGGANVAYDIEVLAASVNFAPHANIALNTGVPGAAASESWVGGIASGTVGFVIQRVELAA